MAKRTTKEAKGRPGDWMESGRGGSRPSAKIVAFEAPEIDEVYAEIENPKQSAIGKVMEAVRDGKALIDDAILFCGRFNQDGRLLRESKRGAKNYKLLHTRSHREYSEAVSRGQSQFKDLPGRIKESDRRREAMQKVKKVLRENFVSNSDLGSNMSLDPNQFTEYTPYFSGPFYKQQYMDYFKGHARAFQEWTHNPVAKRIVDLLIQYSLGRGFKVKCNNAKLDNKWKQFQKKNKIQFKLRKFWGREYLIYGENFIDTLRWVSVDPSTIWDIICEGYDEYIDDVLYYQQMFQTATQMYAGMDVKGVKGSKQSAIGHYIVRQIPFDQIIHIKTNVTSGEKRGRSVYYPILGWLKRLVYLYNAQVLGEQLRASFVWDDTIQGDSGDVAAHAAKYSYIPVAPSIFVHNEAITRKPLAPMSGVTGGAGSNIGNEILALIATSVGIPKDHFNIVSSGGGSRATAIVGSEPFTKVIEDLQEDFSDLLDRIIEQFCADNGADYNEEDWKKIFPSVSKDTISDILKNLAFRETMGWITNRQAAVQAAAECDDDEYDYDDMLKEKATDAADNDPSNFHSAPLPPPPLSPAGRLGMQDKPVAGGEDTENPVHGSGKSAIIKQHKNL